MSMRNRCFKTLSQEFVVCGNVTANPFIVAQLKVGFADEDAELKVSTRISTRHLSDATLPEHYVEALRMAGEWLNNLSRHFYDVTDLPRNPAEAEI